MLRDSKLRFERISLPVRLSAVGVVLLGGLLAAGFRGPSGPALAEDAPAIRAPAAADDIHNDSRMQAMQNMKIIVLAMHSYINNKHRFPPAVLYGPDGKTPYSWRVALLPFLEQDALYKQYRFDEPWDGPNNRKLIDKMPAVFRSPSQSPETHNSAYYVLTGPGTIFDGKEGTTLGQIHDGTANTILLVEAKRDIPWTKPEDIEYNAGKPIPQLGGFFKGGFHAALVEGSAHFISNSIDEQVLHHLITKADGHVIRPEQFRQVPPPLPSAEKSPAAEKPADSAAKELKYDDGKADGKRSFGGSGEMIQFTLPGEKGSVKGVRIHGSRYGLPQPPNEDFFIYILSEDRSEILFTETAPYKLFQRGKEKWVEVNFKKPRDVPKTFWIALDFKAHQTKGVYLSYDTSSGGKHSKVGLPGTTEQEDVDFGGDWMVRVKL